MRVNLKNLKDIELLKKLKTTKGESAFDAVMKEQLKSKSKIPHKSLEEKDVNVKKNKYGNKIFKKDGYTWRSEYEYTCFLILKKLEAKGLIYNLKIGEIFKFIYNNVYIAKYISDFSFKINNEFSGEIQIVVDAKHKQTEKQLKFVWQKKMMKAFYDQEITIFYKNETNIEFTVYNLIKADYSKNVNHPSD